MNVKKLRSSADGCDLEIEHDVRPALLFHCYFTRRRCTAARTLR